MHVMSRVSTWRDTDETASSGKSITSEALDTVLATLTFALVHLRAALLSLSTVGRSTCRGFTGEGRVLRRLSLGLGRK